jgi:hypothetical protein
MLGQGQNNSYKCNDVADVIIRPQNQAVLLSARVFYRTLSITHTLIHTTFRFFLSGKNISYNSLKKKVLTKL